MPIRGVRRLVALSLVAIFAIGGAVNADPRMEATVHATEVKAIRAARLAQNAAIVAGDLEGIARYWTDDLDIRRGLGGFVQGKQAYRQLFADDSRHLFVRMPSSIEVSEVFTVLSCTGVGCAKPAIP